MDSSSTGGVESSLSWSTPVAAVAALGVGGVVLAGAAVVTGDDPAGRLLIGLAALAALMLAALAGVQRPKLTARTDVLAVKTLRGVREYGRDDVVGVRLVPYPRLGRRVPMLEMDVLDQGAERLLIFGRWDLGKDPREVFDALDVRGWVPSQWSRD
ncbi:MAG: PH domain-containing protein [Rhodococcus sp. (in: high G+C Gram-positive bacteria)]